jgi:hypothetical protein
MALYRWRDQPKPHDHMKRIIIVAVVVAAICEATWAAYGVGHRRGFDRALILWNGTFVGTFDALTKIRAGDVQGGTRRIETLCFASAYSVNIGSGAGSETIAKGFLDDFRHYRQTYRNNSAEWSPAERSLERELEKK